MVFSTCPIERPSPGELWDKVASDFSSIVLGGGDLIPESNEWYLTALHVAMSEEFFAYADQLYKENDPRTACCANLLKIGENWGMYPKPAVAASGYVLFKGVPGSKLTDPMEFSIGGIDYRSTGNIPAKLNDEGVATVRFAALEPGFAGNQSGITTSVRVSPAMEGVEADATLFGGFTCGGSDEEECEAFRQRLLDRLAYKPKANYAWLVEKIMEWPCATRVCPRSGECCHDCDKEEPCTCEECNVNLKNEFYVMFDDTFPCGIAPDCVLKEVEDWLFGPSGQRGMGLGEAPLNVCGRLVPVKAGLFKLRIDVHECLNPSQVENIEELVSGLVRTLCPSTELTVQAVNTVLGQVLGPLTKFNVWFEKVNENDETISFDDCHNLIPACDVMLCMQEIRITGPNSEVYQCA